MVVLPASLANKYPNVFEKGRFHSGKKDKAVKVLPKIKNQGTNVAVTTDMDELHLDCIIVILITYMKIIRIKKKKMW
jgi:hypothetical protein